jgi:hypothetical protein
MNVSPVAMRPSLPPVADRMGGSSQAAAALSQTAGQGAGENADQEKLRATFESTFGQTLFGQMMQSMRKSVGKPAYFHGGRGEEVFQKQLDQVVVEKMSHASASQIAGPACDLFMLQRK